MSSFCGAPLAGVLSEAFGYSLHGSSGQQNVAALRSALLGVSMVPWALCACAWIPMRLDSEPHSESCVRFFTYPKDAGARISRYFEVYNHLVRNESDVRRTNGRAERCLRCLAVSMSA